MRRDGYVKGQSSDWQQRGVLQPDSTPFAATVQSFTTALSQQY
jgi:hypothetical protein